VKSGKVLLVPCRAIGLVIGRRGSNIKWLREEFKCEIELLKNEEHENGDMPLYIRSKSYNYKDVLKVEKHVRGQVT